MQKAMLFTSEGVKILLTKFTILPHFLELVREREKYASVQQFFMLCIYSLQVWKCYFPRNHVVSYNQRNCYADFITPATSVGLKLSSIR